MHKPRQTSIGVTPREKENLDRAKRLYEEKTGEKTDWAGFLGAVAALGLTALGVYGLAKGSKKKPAVECPHCGVRFAIPRYESLPWVIYVTCPECAEEVVVSLVQ